VIRFVAALACEARPIARRFGLKAVADDLPFPVFRRDDLWLVVSGIGKVNSAAAAAYLHQLAGGKRNCGWVNFGCCGHGELEIGVPLLAHEIRDRSRDRSWYPPLVFPAPCLSGSIHTVDRAETDYPKPVAYEMEAAGFFEAACHFSTAELVHCLKVVSDGPGCGPQTLTAKGVEELLEGQLGALEKLVSAVAELGTGLRQVAADPPDLEEIRSRWHFTTAQGRQLRRLLERWHVLGGVGDPSAGEISSATTARPVLGGLREKVEALARGPQAIFAGEGPRES